MKKISKRIRFRLQVRTGMVACALGLWISVGCQSPPQSPTYHSKYEEQFQHILNLAGDQRWDEARQRAELLLQKNPFDPAVERLASWTASQQKLYREQALEDTIRGIEAQSSVFNPTIPSLLIEKKDRGLPPRKDVRDAIESIENTPYIPPSFGKTIHQIGPVFSDPSEPTRMSRQLQKKISIHADDLTLSDLIFRIGEAEGISFIADKSMPAFQKKLSLNMEEVRLDEFLQYVGRNLQLQFQIGDDMIWISDASDPKSAVEETRFYRLRKGFIIPAELGPSQHQRRSVTTKGVTTVTEEQQISKFVNDGAAQPSIEEAIKTFFTGSNYMVDYERNIIAASGTQDQLALLERIIEAFDRPVQQVLIEARFITLSQGAFLELGAAWETGRNPTTARNSTDFTGLNPTDFTSLGLQSTFTNILGRADLSATLRALEQSGESQTLSAPRITLINNLPASISDGKVQYYYEEYTVQQEATEQRSVSSLVPSGKPVSITSGVHLDVVASISGDGQSVMLGLHPRVNQDVQLVTFATVTDVDANGRILSTFDIRLPESRTQELSTRVSVKSGQTVAMGGVLEREQTTYVESVPGLGNLPIIGALFRKRTEIDKPRYLLIFVTATIISESGEFIIYRSPTAG